MFVFGIVGLMGGAPGAWAEESRWADGNIPPSWTELSKPTWFCDICNKVFSNGGAWYNHKKGGSKNEFSLIYRHDMTQKIYHISNV